MKQLLTTGIVLSRTDFGEADRIITVLTPEYGKLRLMAKGVRKAKSKLAGGIELFSVSQITFLKGRGEIGTLVSTRLQTHYGNIVKDIDRTQAGYELIKMLNRATEDHPESEYFDLLKSIFESLDDDTIDLELIKLWFQAQMLKLSGHSPNLTSDTSGQKLAAEAKYSFDYDSMAFNFQPQGLLTSEHIKTLRLLFSNHTPTTLSRVQGLCALSVSLSPLLRTISSTHLRAF